MTTTGYCLNCSRAVDLTPEETCRSCGSSDTIPCSDCKPGKPGPPHFSAGRQYCRKRRPHCTCGSCY